MKVRIRSGSQTGSVVDWSRAEAEAAIDTGFAEAYVEPEPIAPAPDPVPGPAAEEERPPEKRRR